MNDTEQKQFRQEMGDVIRKSRYLKEKANLTNKQKRILKDLREREDIIIVKADKGRKTVIMDKKVYDGKVQEILNNGKYETAKEGKDKKTKKKVETIVRRLEREGWINKR